jgi:uncharacterized protein
MESRERLGVGSSASKYRWTLLPSPHKTWGMRMGMRRLFATAALLLGGSWGMHAGAFGLTAAPVPTPVSPAAPVDDETAVAAVRTAKELAYRQALEGFRSAQATAPDDAGLAVSQCRFIDNFTDEDYGEWIESASADHEACLEQLQLRWRQAPEARFYLYQQQWGEDAIAMGETLLELADAWPVPLRTQLYAAQARNYTVAGNTIRAGKLALLAARLGDSESVPVAVGELLRLGDEAGAARLLRETPAATIGWHADRRLQAALTLKNPEVALTELRRYHGNKAVNLDTALVARIYLNAKDVAAASKALGDTGVGDGDSQVRFDTALMGGNIAVAVAQVRVTDVDNLASNLERFAVLATHFPSALLHFPMLGMALLAGGILLGLAALPVLLLAPVHYRGLARRVRGRVLKPMFPTVGLRHAWWGLALMLALPFLVTGLVEPRSLAVLFAGETLPAADPLFRLTLWSTVACLLLLSPSIWGMGRSAFQGESTLLRQAGWLLVALAVLYAVAFLQGAWIQWRMEDSRTMQTEMVDLLVQGGRSAYGPLLAFALMAVLVPIFEEVVFRGLLLAGMARHISFGWANLIQALLFAVVHNDFPRFFFYFTMGLLAGGLVRKTRSLTPAIALHAINNGAFFLIAL